MKFSDLLTYSKRYTYRLRESKRTILESYYINNIILSFIVLIIYLTLKKYFSLDNSSPLIYKLFIV